MRAAELTARNRSQLYWMIVGVVVVPAGFLLGKRLLQDLPPGDAVEFFGFTFSALTWIIAVTSAFAAVMSIIRANMVLRWLARTYPPSTEFLRRKLITDRRVAAAYVLVGPASLAWLAAAVI